MRIAIDISSLQGKHSSGIGRYVTNLVTSLQTHQEVELIATHRLSSVKRLRSLQKISPIRIQPAIPFTFNCDLFHGPDFKIPRTHRFKKIVTIHDMVIFQEDLSDPEFKESSIHKFDYMIESCRPDAIITVSHFIKDQLIEHAPSYASKISVVYHGVDHIVKPKKLKSFFEFPYIVYVGTIERRKNVIRIVQAFEKIHKQFPDLRLILIGSKGFNANETFERIEKSSIKEKIIYKGYVPDEDLIHAIGNARIFIYPSIYEGFGFPVLEAMRLGVPVITSNMGVLKEVGGDGACLVDPYNPREIADHLSALLENEGLRQSFIKKGYERTNTFTWEKCAKETILAYQKAIR